MNTLPTVEFLAYSLAASAYIAYILPEVSEAKLEKRECIRIRNKKVLESPIKITDLARCTNISLWLFNLMWIFASASFLFSCSPMLKNIMDYFNLDWFWWIMNLGACATAVRGIHIWTTRIAPLKR